MKRIASRILCISIVCTLLLCGCNTDKGPAITVVTEGSLSLSGTTESGTTTTTHKDAAPAPTTSGSTARPTIATDAGSNPVGTAIAETALSLIGTPFKEGGTGPDSFDNPGFVIYCYKQAGYTLPKRAAAMAEFGTEVSLTALQPGDLLLFSNDLGGNIQFTGICIGNNQFVACNNPSSPTKVQSLSGYWGERLLAARRAA